MVNQRRKTVVLLGLLILLFGSTFEQQDQPLNSVTERRALLDLRSSLGLRTRDWPKKSDPCLIWNGVHCNGGRVIGINISGFRRTRIGLQNPQFSVDSLANLTLLASFNASFFELPGSIPDWFGQIFLSLQVLDLRSCSINGSIPLSIGNITSLTNLYLSNNRITGGIPNSLGQLSHLLVLDLSQNRLTGSIPTTFSALGNLSLLDMSSNFLIGQIPPTIGLLSKLQVLNLSKNSLSSSIPGPLGDLNSLVDFDLSFNSLSGSLPLDLRGLKNLQRMVISGNSLTGTIPKNLFTTLNQLQFIELSQNNFTGDFPDTFLSMPSLQFLDASVNNFTGFLPNPGLNFRPTDAVFNLSYNMLYGNLTSVLNKIKFADLSGNYFEGSVLDYAQINASLNMNCLQNVSNQRTLQECQSFYTKMGQIFDNFGLPNTSQSPLPPFPIKPKKKHENLVIILASVLGGLGFIALLICLLVLLFLCARKGSGNTQRGNEVGPVPTSRDVPPSPGVSVNMSSIGESFTYQQLLEATNSFNDTNLIKHGESGDLFRGILEGGINVVIKRIDLQSVKKDGYLNELNISNKILHNRFVPFLGHCLENENDKFIVYKYMPNQDLTNALFKKTKSENDSLQSLDWITRLKIAIGAAEGLAYLHHECTPPLVHRDVQASSILLDDKFEVRLGSLREVCAQEGETNQRKISRLLRIQSSSSDQSTSGSSTATCAYDVYCFGKVLLELVTGKLGISASNETNNKELLEEILPYINIYEIELLNKIVDPSLILDDDFREEVWAMSIVAKSCLNPKPSRRPPMRHILKALENPFKVVREEGPSSARLRTTSSRGSWNAALYGSWRQSSSDVSRTTPASFPGKLENDIELGGGSHVGGGSHGGVD